MTDWGFWQASWDEQQESYLPDREERLAAMLDAVEGVVGSAPRVLDLACGPASITTRVLARFPSATVVGVDVDPVLLAIARGVHAADGRVSFVAADLREPDWAQAVPHEKGFDAVLTATALHWLAEPDLTRLYADLARLVRAGGIYCNADHMPLVGAPRLSAAVNAATVRLQEQARAASGALDWDSWWAAAAAEPALAELMIERGGLFEGTGHPVEFTPPATWHVTRLRHGGFTEAAVIWRDRADGVIAAVR